MENNKNNFKEYPDVVGIAQLQKILGIGRSLAYRLVKDKTIKSIKSGREYKILKSNIINYLMGELNEWY